MKLLLCSSFFFNLKFTQIFCGVLLFEKLSCRVKNACAHFTFHNYCKAKSFFFSFLFAHKQDKVKTLGRGKEKMLIIAEKTLNVGLWLQLPECCSVFLKYCMSSVWAFLLFELHMDTIIQFAIFC